MEVLRASTPLPVAVGIVERCLDRKAQADRAFLRALRSGIAGLSRSERSKLAPVTGHVAESVVEVLLDEMGWMVASQQIGPGGHGVDLILLSPDFHAVAFEVKERWCQDEPRG